MSNLKNLIEDQTDLVIELEQQLKKQREDFERILTLIDGTWVKASIGSDINKIGVLSSTLGIIEGIVELNLK